jgi:hypothetical protein
LTVAELEERMSLREFTDWQAFNRLEPFLPERVDLAGALVTSMLANINRPKGRRAFSVDDFMLVARTLEAGKPPPTPQQEADYMKSVIMGLGGEV